MTRALWWAIRSKAMLAGLFAASGCLAIADLDHEYELASGSGGAAGEGGAGGVGGVGGAGGNGSCEPGATRACYEGPPGTENIGACKGGVQTCSPDGVTWSVCQGQVVPVGETCSTPVDDDCNGLVNEGGLGCVCVPNATTQPCYSGPMGTEMNPPCHPGTQTCNADGTGFGPCLGEVMPTVEDCSTPTDENCNGAEGGGADVAAGCVCVPDTVKNCYTGPAGTQDVGICQSGTQTCSVDGFGYGPCKGEVLPQTEDCATKGIDEDCDGASGEPCGGDTHWSKRAGDNAAAQGYAVAVDSQGNVVIAGAFEGSIDFGGGALISAGGADIFVAKLGPDGTHIWSRRIGNDGDDYAFDVAIDAAGEIVFVGAFDSLFIDFGGGVHSNQGILDAFAVKLDEQGNYIWSRVFGAANQELATSVAAAPSGEIYVCGTYYGSPDFGTGSLPSGGGSDYVLVKLESKNGLPQWAKGFGDGASQPNCLVASDSVGNAIMAMPLLGTVDFEGGPLTADYYDVAVAKFTPAGNHQWSKRFGDPDYQDARAVVVDSLDRILITGVVGGSVDFGGGVLAAANQDALVLRLNGDGSHSLSKLVGGAADQVGADIAVGDSNSIVLVGNFANSIDFGTGFPSIGLSAPEGFALKLSSAGGYVWGRPFVGQGEQQPTSVAADALGNVLMTGYFSDGIDFGGGANNHVGLGGYDVFIAKLQK